MNDQQTASVLQTHTQRKVWRLAPLLSVFDLPAHTCYLCRCPSLQHLVLPASVAQQLPLQLPVQGSGNDSLQLSVAQWHMKPGKVCARSRHRDRVKADVRVKRWSCDEAGRDRG